MSEQWTAQGRGVTGESASPRLALTVRGGYAQRSRKAGRWQRCKAAAWTGPGRRFMPPAQSIALALWATATLAAIIAAGAHAAGGTAPW